MPKQPPLDVTTQADITGINADDILIDPKGERCIVETVIDDDWSSAYFVLRPQGAPRNTNVFRYLTFDDFATQHWMHLPREEVSSMAKQSTEATTIGRLRTQPPTMTKAEWLKRGKAKVTFTKAELEHLARLVAAGHVLLRNEVGISSQLKAAMSRLDVNTKGL